MNNNFLDSNQIIISQNLKVHLNLYWPGKVASLYLILLSLISNIFPIEWDNFSRIFLYQF